MIELSELKQVDLRSIWKNEATDFTRWLSEDENIALIGKAIGGLEICRKNTEAPVGDFSLDILAEDVNTGDLIAIENQLEKTDHDHLGKLLTYAAGYETPIIIWIVKEARDEHIKAIQWLNEKTNDDVNFFLLEIQVWQIDNSNPAPKFQVIEKPNNWAKQLNNSKKTTKTVTSTDLLKLEFWQGLKNYCLENNLYSLTQTPDTNSWYIIRIGTTKAKISLRLNTINQTINCELLIEEDSELFSKLYEHKNHIEKQLGENLIWENKEDYKRCKIYLQEHISLDNKEEWIPTYNWLAKNIILFKNTFTPLIF